MNIEQVLETNNIAEKNKPNSAWKNVNKAICCPFNPEMILTSRTLKELIRLIANPMSRRIDKVILSRVMAIGNIIIDKNVLPTS